jgi:hypothetical protein
MSLPQKTKTDHAYTWSVSPFASRRFGDQSRTPTVQRVQHIQFNEQKQMPLDSGVINTQVRGIHHPQGYYSPEN